MEFLLIAIIGILAALFAYREKNHKNQSYVSNEYPGEEIEKEPKVKNDIYVFPYKKRDDFLSAAELSFYRTLGVFLEEKAVICPKVTLKEVVFIGKEIGKDYMKYFNFISRKHVDFVLCDKISMQVICAVELDDKSHQREERKQRDVFVDHVFEAAKIPIFHIPLKNGYSIGEFTDILNCFPEQPTAVVENPVQVSNEPEVNQAVENIPLCLKCNIPMVKRKALHGENAGKEFYGCSNYPKCREVKQILHNEMDMNTVIS